MELGKPKTVLHLANPSTNELVVIPKTLRPDTGDGRSLRCARCPVVTPDAMFAPCCGTPMCENCLAAHIFCESGHEDG